MAFAQDDPVETGLLGKTRLLDGVGELRSVTLVREEVEVQAETHGGFLT
jgi:hypothetical protein